jgi:multidrug resistance efflux pump
MRRFSAVLAVVALAAAAAGAYLSLRPTPSPEVLATGDGPGGGRDLFPGKTQPAPGRSAHIAPAVLHPVVEVRVKAGDRVKKDQPLVEIDADEPKADLAAKKAALEATRAGLARLKAEPREEEQKEAEAQLRAAAIALKEAQRYLERIKPGHEQGVVPEQRYHEAQAHLAKSEAEHRAATARLRRLQKRAFAQEVAEVQAKVAEAAANMKASEAELEHYTVTAAIDGVVSWLSVDPGTVSRPGTSVWGEILDLSELDVRCELLPRQADRLRVGDTAEVVVDDERAPRLAGKVSVIGVGADAASGRIPVLVRLPNPEGRVRCYVEVKVHFPGVKAAANR